VVEKNERALWLIFCAHARNESLVTKKLQAGWLHKLSFPTSFPEKRSSQVDRPAKVASRPNDSVSPAPNERNPSGRKGNGKTMATKRCIDAACDEFFRSRGIQITEGFNSWRKLRSMEESMDGDDQ
jgi:hypothetical protein